MYYLEYLYNDVIIIIENDIFLGPGPGVLGPGFYPYCASPPTASI